MKHINVLILILVLFFSACYNNNDFDNIVENEFEKCTKPNNDCVIDFTRVMKFEWDCMYYFSGANSIEDIEKELKTKYSQWEEVGDRVIFLNKGKIVYQKYWFYNPSEELKGVVFITNLKSFKVDKSNARFKITKEEKAFYLEQL